MTFSNPFPSTFRIRHCFYMAARVVENSCLQTLMLILFMLTYVCFEFFYQRKLFTVSSDSTNHLRYGASYLVGNFRDERGEELGLE